MYLLKSAKFNFKICSNYKNLVQKLNRRQAYWTLYLLRFDFTLKQIRKKMDRSSKRPDEKVDIEKDNENQK